MKDAGTSDEEDPFMKVMNFLEGKTMDSLQTAIKLDNLFKSITYNVMMLIFLLTAVFILLVVGTPLFLGSENPTLRGAGALLHVIVGLTNGCHQLPYRTLIIDGIPQPVCARDAGIYVGAILGFATILLKTPPKILREKKSLILAFAPILLDGASQTILALRESNNAIRLATGFIFTFFLIGFLTQRFFSARYPGFREKVLNIGFLAVDLIAVALLCYKLAPIAYDFGSVYMSKGEAVSAALANSSIGTPIQVKAYYVAPLAPVSLIYDPFYGRHDDILLKDLHEMPYYNKTPCASPAGDCTGLSAQPNQAENATVDEILHSTAEEKHNLGLWVVAVLEETPSPASDPYIKAGRGEYYYFDAYTHELIEERNH